MLYLTPASPLRPRLKTATGMIVGPNESLKEIFPEGSDSAAWKKAMEHTRLKNDVADIEARYAGARCFCIFKR